MQKTRQAASNTLAVFQLTCQSKIKKSTNLLTFIIVSAVICGAEVWNDTELYGEQTEE